MINLFPVEFFHCTCFFSSSTSSHTRGSVSNPFTAFMFLLPLGFSLVVPLPVRHKRNFIILLQTYYICSSCIFVFYDIGQYTLFRAFLEITHDYISYMDYFLSISEFFKLCSEFR